MLLIGLTACLAEPDVSAETSGVLMRDSAGVLIVENSSSTDPAPGAWEVSPAPILTIGAVSGEPAVQFTRVGGMTRLSDGRVVVVDIMTNEARYFSPTGEHLLTATRSGEGPGEFTFIQHLIRLSGDSILLEGRPGFRQVVLGPDGGLARDGAVDRSALAELGLLRGCSGFPLPDGSRIECAYAPGGAERVTMPEGWTHIGMGLARTRARYTWVAPDLSTTVPLGLFEERGQFGVSFPDGSLSYASHPFYTGTAHTHSNNPRRHYVSRTGAYSIEVWALDGRLERIIRRIGARRLADAVLSERALSIAAFDVPEEQRWNRVVQEMEIPDSIPAVNGMAAGPAGELLVQRTHSIEEDAESVYDLFDAEGRFMGELRFPPRFTIREVGEDYILGLRLDELDVAFVEVYALTRAPG